MEDTKLCTNCKRDISTANFVMHEMHCRRHIILCEHCEEPIPRVELEQHFNELHAKVPCERCQKEISKEDMEKHLANECSKIPARCEFCELSFPKDELTAHLDYCGSRTECCPLCQQYIMLKDMLRHENSGCTYPEPKPAPPPAVDPDPFSLEELQQLFNGTDFGAPNLFSDPGSQVFGNLQRNGASWRAANSQTATNGIRSVAWRPGTLKTGGNASSKKSDVNVQRGRNLTTQTSENDFTSIPPDMDYDTMLALQLAHDEWAQDADNDTDSRGLRQPAGNAGSPADASDYLTAGTQPWTNMVPSPAPAPDRGNNFSVTDDDMTIQCDVCGVEVPLSTYLDHTDNCTRIITDTQHAYDLNNELSSPHQSTGRASIPVINNLRTYGASQAYESLSPDHEGLDGDIMLPCEFCEDMYPSEIIIQHQTVCQLNGMTTPRMTTPASGVRNVNPKPPTNPMSFKPSIKPRPRRQPDPVHIDFTGQDGGDVGEHTLQEASNTRLRRVVESSSNKYSPAVDRFDEAMTRPPRRPARQLSQENEEDEEAGDANGAVRRPSKSAQRARARLNQLLQEDNIGNAGVGVTGASRKQPKVGGASENKTDSRERRGQVNSRMVMRQLEGENQRVTRTRPAGGSSSSSRATQEGTTPAPVFRNRQRADHVFSPELRLKPDHNPPSSRR